MPSREKLRQRRNKADERAAGEHNSLFGEILDWMLAPLMFVWPISIAIIHNVADDIAHATLFLASDYASWITGQVLPVSGHPFP